MNEFEFQSTLDAMKSSGFTVAVAFVPESNYGSFRLFTKEDEMEAARIEEILFGFEKMSSLLKKRLTELDGKEIKQER